MGTVVPGTWTLFLGLHLLRLAGGATGPAGPHALHARRHARTSKRLIRVLRISGRSSAFSRPLAIPLATRRQDSCRSSFRMRGGCLSAALGRTLLWNSSFVYMDGGCNTKRERVRERER